MKILSVYPYTHISSAALVVNGRIVAAAPEERFNREKLSTKFPFESAKWCLEKNNIKWDELDCIAVPWNPAENLNDVSNRWIGEMRWRGEMIPNVVGSLLRAINGKPPNEMDLRFGKTRLLFLNHHDCHSANGFYQSPFINADILNIDGHGENETTVFSKGTGSLIKKLHSIKYPHSLGLLYGTFTDFLGFKPDSDEWKVMALSSFSKKINKYDNKLEKLFSLSNDGFELNLSYFNYFLFDRQKHFFSEKFLKLFGNPRTKDTELKTHHYEVAGALQRGFKKIADHLIRILKSISGEENLVLSGGAALNCVYNGTISNKIPYKNSFISANPDDSGVSIGAALLAYSKLTKRRKTINIHHNYYGPEYSNSEIVNLLKNLKIRYSQPKNLHKFVAKQIASKKLVGWFQGKMEFGHRALGNRSILADPRLIEMKDIINQAVKYREHFRPFAPVVYFQEAHKIFNIKKYKYIRFMERAVKVNKDWAKKLPAITHIDGTARVQTVSERENKTLCILLKEFKKISGVPVLLNTSFNLNGEPIVMSPRNAIRTFFSCGLDLLVLGKYVVQK